MNRILLIALALVILVSPGFAEEVSGEGEVLDRVLLVEVPVEGESKIEGTFIYDFKEKKILSGLTYRGITAFDDLLGLRAGILSDDGQPKGILAGDIDLEVAVAKLKQANYSFPWGIQAGVSGHFWLDENKEIQSSYGIMITF
jgi:hypothetical protein